ncbi:MAG: hypothetical protein V4484_01555 [Pseudomonadota bacterium]
MILRDHSHISPDDIAICAHCGQPLPLGHGHVHDYGDKRVSSVGLGVTVALHLLLLLAFWFRSQLVVKLGPPPGGSIAYIAPLEGKPKKKEAARTEPKVAKHSKPVVMKIARLPNTITLPNEKRVEVAEVPPEPPKMTKVDPDQDMTAAIEARRRARGAAPSDQQGEESDKDRGTRLALANIAAANGKAQGNDTGGVFDIADKTFNSAQLKFKGWKPSFNRRWLTQVHVELGTERDIETAIVKKMVELIRKEKQGDFDWESHRLQRVVKMSARVEDSAELEAFLLKEMFPAYTVPRTR